MSAQLLTEYDATVDNKKRVVLRGLPAAFDHYHVSVYRDSENNSYTLRMEPRVLASLDQLSSKTLRMMDRAMGNLARGKAGEPVDLQELAKHVDGEE